MSERTSEFLLLTAISGAVSPILEHCRCFQVRSATIQSSHCHLCASLASSVSGSSERRRLANMAGDERPLMTEPRSRKFRAAVRAALLKGVLSEPLSFPSTQSVTSAATPAGVSLNGSVGSCHRGAGKSFTMGGGEHTPAPRLASFVLRTTAVATNYIIMEIEREKERSINRATQADPQHIR